MRDPNASIVELKQWPILKVNDYVTDTTPKARSFVVDGIQFCARDPRRQEIIEHLDRLSAMDRSNLHTILGLLFDHTSWPDNPSGHSLSEFMHLLSLVSPCDTPEKVLDKIIRFRKNADCLHWLLSWLL